MNADRLLAQAKVAAAGEVVRGSNPWSTITPVYADLREVRPGSLAGLDALVCGLDSLGARYLATRLGHAAGVPMFDLGTRADLRTVRVTSGAPGGPCQCCSWSAEHLTRAGESLAAPCAAIDTPTPFSATMSAAQAVGALAADQVLAAIGAHGEPPRLGTELRLDLHRGRLDRFALPQNPDCPADHRLASTPRQELPEDADVVSLGEWMSRLDIGIDAALTFASTVVVETSACTRCGRIARPFTAANELLPACATCGAPSTPVRRARRLRWSDAAAIAATRPAAPWFQPGEVFLVSDEHGTRAFSIPALPLDRQPGRPWDDRADTPRFSRLPAAFRLPVVRAARIGLVGVGHAGGAFLHAIAALPWSEILILDRDRFEAPNLAVHPFGSLGHLEDPHG